MTLLERVAHLVPRSSLRWVEAVDQEMTGPHTPFDGVFPDLARDSTRELGHSARERLLSDVSPPLGVYGVGLVLSDQGRLQPAVFVMAELIGIGASSRAITWPIRASPVARLLGSSQFEVPDDALVVAIPPPMESGIKLNAGGPRGTVGLPVWTREMAPAVLTAGHVASTVGAGATANGSPIGSVTYTNHRRLHAHPEAAADVGVVALTDEGLNSLAAPGVTGIGDATELGVVRALNSSGVGGAGEQVRSLHPRFALDRSGVWAEVILIDAAISEGGDSGSIVVDEHERVVGQIVGGHPPTYSLAQDIDLLLSDSTTTLRL